MGESDLGGLLPAWSSLASLALPARTESDRLHDLLCHACAIRDATDLAEVHAQTLQALANVLVADRGALAVAEPGGGLVVAASGGLSPASLTAIEQLSATAPPDPELLAVAMAPDGIASVAVWPLPGDDGPAGLLVAAYDASHEIDDDERRMAEVLSSHVATA